MFKKITLTFMIAVFTLALLTPAFCAEGPAGNDRKGKYTYRKVFKACSEAGETPSASPTVSPSDKTMAEWKTIFESRDFTAFGCLNHWAGLTEEDILDIYSYFYHHASDSPSPATCK